MNAKVRDVMTRDVVSVHRYTPFKDIARTLFDLEISALPVVDDAQLVVGIVCAADLIEKQARNAKAAPPGSSEPQTPGPARGWMDGVSAETLMTSPVVTVTPEADTATAARLMRRNAVKHLPVVNRAGRLVGIVSEKDLLTVFLRPDLDIQDEIVRAILLSEPGTVLSEVRVRVDDGIATLTGPVADEDAARSLVRRVKGVDGVVEVIDRIAAEADG
jgi:CBS domain-containing protein